MISIPSAPRALHPSLGSAIAAPGPGVPHTVTGPVSPATLLSAQTLSKTADAESSYPDTTKSGSSNKSSNSGVASHGPSSSSTGPGVDSKRPKIRRSTSHSSRNVHLTEEITPREMALAIIQAQYHIYHSDLSGYLAGGAMVQDALTKYALG
ncbi:hypothetical protein BGW38_004386, partial [Lunasporangiospora selenospora]